MEISFPKSWLSVPKESSKLELTDDILKILHIIQSKPNLPKPCMDVQLHAGYYTTVEDLVNEMNRCLVNAILIKPTSKPINPALSVKNSNLPTIMYNNKNLKVSVSLQPHNTLKFHKHLASVLGFGENPIVNSSNEVKIIEANAVSNIDGSMHSLYVYTDVIENVNVGDTEAPLLRIVEAEGKFGEVIHQSFEMPSYIPLRKKSFDSIEIDIRDVFGNPVSFENGVVVVTLHFRRATYL